MSNVIIKQADVFCETDRVNRCGFVEVAGDLSFYRAVKIAGETSNDDRFATFDEALAVVVAHADAIDSTDVTDKKTRLEYELKIRELEAEIARLRKEASGLAEVAAGAEAVDVKG